MSILSANGLIWLYKLSAGESVFSVQKELLPLGGLQL
jgi:hypothetical protein